MRACCLVACERMTEIECIQKLINKHGEFRLAAAKTKPSLLCTHLDFYFSLVSASSFILLCFCVFFFLLDYNNGTPISHLLSTLFRLMELMALVGTEVSYFTQLLLLLLLRYFLFSSNLFV